MHNTYPVFNAGAVTPVRRLFRGLLSLIGVTLFVTLLLAPAIVHAQGETPAPSVAIHGSEVWSASMTVGNNSGLLGYTTFSERTVGALTTNTFSWRGRNYSVTNIAYRTRGAGQTWDVLVDFWPPLPEEVEGLALRLGDTWLNFTDARGDSRQFFWDGLI